MRREQGRIARGGLRFARAVLTRANLMAVLLLASQSPGHSEFLVDGSRDNLVVKADKARLSDIVDELGRKFDVRVKSPLPLDVRVNGRFSGPLTSVIRRLLQSYDFVLALGQGGDVNSIVVIVSGQKNSNASRTVLQTPADPPRFPGREQGGN